MAKGFAIHNAPTDHGGLIPATQFRDSQMGNAFVRAGDGHFCPKCKCWSTVIKSHDHVIIDGKPVAYVGDKLTCGARIQPQQSHVVGDSGSYYYEDQLDNRFSAINTKVFDEQIQVILDNSFENLFKGFSYRLKIGDKTFEGILDAEGKTSRFDTVESEQVSEFELFFSGDIKYFSELEGEE